MQSAFGIEHGYISKAARYTGDDQTALNRKGGMFRRHSSGNVAAKNRLAEHFMQTGQKSLKDRAVKLGPKAAKLRMVP